MEFYAPMIKDLITSFFSMKSRSVVGCTESDGGAKYSPCYQWSSLGARITENAS